MTEMLCRISRQFFCDVGLIVAVMDRNDDIRGTSTVALRYSAIH